MNHFFICSLQTALQVLGDEVHGDPGNQIEFSVQLEVKRGESIVGRLFVVEHGKDGGLDDSESLFPIADRESVMCSELEGKKLLSRTCVPCNDLRDFITWNSGELGEFTISGVTFQTCQTKIFHNLLMKKIIPPPMCSVDHWKQVILHLENSF